MKKSRLDQLLVRRGMSKSRSQAENYIKLGKVRVSGKINSKPGSLVSVSSEIVLLDDKQYVSRGALKLDSVTDILKIDFKGKAVLDVGSSTGGFTDFALKQGAKKVAAVDVGTAQMHPELNSDPRVELYEKTDIRDFKKPADRIDIVLIDVSFISIRKILPAVAALVGSKTQIVAMLKPQFEAGEEFVNKGIIKNKSLRRQVLVGFELWAKQYFLVLAKADSKISGSKGNVERFYLLQKIV